MSSPPSPAPGAEACPQGSASRQAWIDNLRTLMIVLVVNMHACVTFSHVGSWYRMEDPEPALGIKIVFILWQAHLQAFFMGLLFFVAGVFAYASLERRGSGSFLRERGRRLGLPSLLYMVVIHPFMVYVLLGTSGGPARPGLGELYRQYLTSGRVLSGSGPMWFTLALLAFCVVLTGLRAWSPSPGLVANPSSRAPGGAALVGFGGMLLLSTFLMRLAQPVGTNVVNFQLGFFAQYVAAFVVGVVAGRQGWLEALAKSRQARRAGWFGVVGGPLLLTAVAVLGGPPPEDGTNPYGGGWNLRAFAYTAWEQSVGLAIALGVLAWFHRWGNGTGRMAKWFSDRAFAVYLFHAPVLVALTPLMRPVAIHPFVGAAVLTLAGLVGSFLVADWARRLPGLRAIL